MLFTGVFGLFLRFDEYGELFAEELDQVDDLDEETMDDWIVQILESALISILLYNLVLLIVILLCILQQITILGHAQVWQ